MWKRNLLFVAPIGLGLLAFQASVFPPEFKGEESAALIDRPSLDETAVQVDRALEASWSEQGITPAPLADDLTIARRLSLGLMGVVPSLAEIREFEAQPEERRLDWWLARVLADPRCNDYLAERLARAYVVWKMARCCCFAVAASFPGWRTNWQTHAVRPARSFADCRAWHLDVKASGKFHYGSNQARQRRRARRQQACGAGLARFSARGWIVRSATIIPLPIGSKATFKAWPLILDKPSEVSKASAMATANSR